MFSGGRERVHWEQMDWTTTVNIAIWKYESLLDKSAKVMQNPRNIGESLK